jgi:hypothetical protein
MTMPEKFGLPEEPVSSDTVEAAAWLAIKKDMRPKSVWSFKDRSLAKVETYANAAEVVYAAFVLARSRGVNLLPDFHVRTTSLTRSGRCVRVGPYKNGDFHLSQSGSFFRYDDISPDSPGLFLAGFLLFCTHISNHIK